MRSFEERQSQIAAMPTDLAILNASLLLGDISSAEAAIGLEGLRDSWRGVSGQFGRWEPVAVANDFVFWESGEKVAQDKGTSIGNLGRASLIGVRLKLPSDDTAVDRMAIGIKFLPEGAISASRNNKPLRWVLASLLEPKRLNDSSDSVITSRPVFRRLPEQSSKRAIHTRSRRYYFLED